MVRQKGVFWGLHSIGGPGFRAQGLDLGPQPGAWVSEARFPSFPFWFGVSLLKPNSRQKGTLMIKGFIGEPGKVRSRRPPGWRCRLADLGK